MTETPTGGQKRLPLPLKLAFTAFVCVLVPFYLTAYGPANFLYFCDVALMLTLVAVWTEHPLPASMAAVGILLPQTLWVIDLATVSLGIPLIGMTDYMYNASVPLSARLLSLFHGWLPFLLVFLVWRLGYDRRALLSMTMLAWVLIAVCYLFVSAGPRPIDNPNLAVNVNYVYGPSDAHPQTWMHPLLWLSLLSTAMPLIMYLPTHLLLGWTAGRKQPPGQAS